MRPEARPPATGERVLGRIPVLESLRARRRKARRLYILRGAQGLEAIVRHAQHIPVEERTRYELDAMAGGVPHQGVVLDADPLPVVRAEEWAKRTFPADAVVVALDSVEDPHNFGAIVRSASAFGACAVIFGKDRAAPLSPAAMKSAAGAMEYIELVQAVNLVRALDAMKEAGFWVAGLEADAPQTIWQADLGGRIALVVGSEGKGLRRLVGEHCDLHLSIPLTGAITSLNASVSAAVALAECARRRTARQTPPAQGKNVT